MAFEILPKIVSGALSNLYVNGNALDRTKEGI